MLKTETESTENVLPTLGGDDIFEIRQPSVRSDRRTYPSPDPFPFINRLTLNALHNVHRL